MKTYICILLIGVVCALCPGCEEVEYQEPFWLSPPTGEVIRMKPGETVTLTAKTFPKYLTCNEDATWYSNKMTAAYDWTLGHLNGTYSGGGQCDNYVTYTAAEDTYGAGSVRVVYVRILMNDDPMPIEYEASWDLFISPE